jgi:hypothetical protein
MEVCMKIIALFSARTTAAAAAAATMAAATVLLSLAGCATPAAYVGAAGQARDAAIARLGAPTARHALPAGGERLEYATGPFGRSTWMLDVDTGGRITTAKQVLNEANFADFQGRAPGLTRAELLRELGTPGERQGAGLRGGELWSWRYPTNDCLWFQVEIDTAADKVRAAGYNIDPRCDAPSDRN